MEPGARESQEKAGCREGWRGQCQQGLPHWIQGVYWSEVLVANDRNPAHTNLSKKVYLLTGSL